VVAGELARQALAQVPDRNRGGGAPGASLLLNRSLSAIATFSTGSCRRPIRPFMAIETLGSSKSASNSSVTISSVIASICPMPAPTLVSLSLRSTFCMFPAWARMGASSAAASPTTLASPRCRLVSEPIRLAPWISGAPPMPMPGAAPPAGPPSIWAEHREHVVLLPRGLLRGRLGRLGLLRRRRLARLLRVVLVPGDAVADLGQDRVGHEQVVHLAAGRADAVQGERPRTTS
jgi:hypothetical protein